jgi:hypothetical protein
VRRLLGLALAAIAACAQSAGSKTQAPALWVFSSLERVGRQAAPGRETSAHLFAARGEFEAFQIAVQAPSSGLELLGASSSELRGSRNQRIAASNVTLYRERYVYVDKASPDWSGKNRSLGSGWYPDPLIPFSIPRSVAQSVGEAYRAAPVRIAERENVPLWVDVFIPREAAPGEYNGIITISTDHGELRVNWALTVWNFDVPDKPSLNSSFAFWNTVAPEAAEELLRHRLMPQKLGSIDRAGERRMITSHGLKMTDLGFWSGADQSHCSMMPAPSVPEIHERAARHDPRLYLFNYTADEISQCAKLYSTLKQWSTNLHRAGIHNLVVMVPTPELYDDGSGSGRSAVDIWVVLPEQYDKNLARISEVRDKGDEVWSYNALVQDPYSPKWLIDYDPINYRLQSGFLSAALNLTGLLYWRIDRWPDQNWDHMVNNTGTFSSGNFPGDGMLVYPGAPAGVPGIVPSLRLKQLREGVEDFEYVQILKRLGRGDWALEQVRPIAPDWTNWTRDPNRIETVRRRLGAEIERLSVSAPALSH